MTAQEMLIEVNTSLQAIGASRTRKFYPEEIEWYLNKMINRFVQGSIRRKETSSSGAGYATKDVDITVFEVDELYRDAIRNLIMEQYLPSNYATSGLSAVAYLPPDYNYLTDIGACTQACSLFNSSLLSTKVYQVIGVPFPTNSVASDHHYFSNLSITLNGTGIYSRTGYYSYDSAFQVIEEICNYTNIVQNMAGPYKKMGYLLLLVPKPDSGNAQFIINYDTTASAPITLTSAVLNTITANETGVAPSPANSPVRSIRDTVNYNSNITPYYKSSPNSITTSMRGMVISINTAVNFIVNGIWISYIRKPSRISVSLNNSSDIDPDYHNQICDMTVQHIRERIGDPKWQTGNVDMKQD